MYSVLMMLVLLTGTPEDEALELPADADAEETCDFLDVNLGFWLAALNPNNDEGVDSADDIDYEEEYESVEYNSDIQDFSEVVIIDGNAEAAYTSDGKPIEITPKCISLLEKFPNTVKMSFRNYTFRNDCVFHPEKWKKLKAFKINNELQKNKPGDSPDPEVGSVYIPTKMLKSIIKFPELEFLACRIQSKDIPLLVQMKKLKSLHLEITRDEDLKAILPLSKQLTNLTLSGKFTPAAGQLLSQFTQLKSLYVIGPVDDTFISEIKKLDLVKLDLLGPKITWKSISVIADWKSLEKVAIYWMPDEEAPVPMKKAEALLDKSDKYFSYGCAGFAE